MRQARIVELPGAIDRCDAQQRRQHQTWDHARHEQLTHRSGRDTLAARAECDATAGCDRIDHHHDGRRDQDAKRARRGDDACAETLGESLRHHRRHQDRSDGDDGRRRRS